MGNFTRKLAAESAFQDSQGKRAQKDDVDAEYEDEVEALAKSRFDDYDDQSEDYDDDYAFELVDGHRWIIWTTYHLDILNNASDPDYGPNEGLCDMSQGWQKAIQCAAFYAFLNDVQAKIYELRQSGYGRDLPAVDDRFVVTEDGDSLFGRGGGYPEGTELAFNGTDGDGDVEFIVWPPGETEGKEDWISYDDWVGAIDAEYIVPKGGAGQSTQSPQQPAQRIPTVPDLQAAYDAGQAADAGAIPPGTSPGEDEAFRLGNYDMWGGGFGAAPKKTRKVTDVDQNGMPVVARWRRKRRRTAQVTGECYRIEEQLDARGVDGGEVKLPPDLVVCIVDEDDDGVTLAEMGLWDPPEFYWSHDMLEALHDAGAISVYDPNEKEGYLRRGSKVRFIHRGQVADAVVMLLKPELEAVDLLVNPKQDLVDEGEGFNELPPMPEDVPLEDDKFIETLPEPELVEDVPMDMLEVVDAEPDVDALIEQLCPDCGHIGCPELCPMDCGCAACGIEDMAMDAPPIDPMGDEFIETLPSDGIIEITDVDVEPGLAIEELGPVEPTNDELTSMEMEMGLLESPIEEFIEVNMDDLEETDPDNLHMPPDTFLENNDPFEPVIEPGSTHEPEMALEQNAADIVEDWGAEDWEDDTDEDGMPLESEDEDEEIPGGPEPLDDEFYDEDELEMGVEEETSEHTDGDEEVGEEIAKDHLSEEPDYYSEAEETESEEESEDEGEESESGSLDWGADSFETEVSESEDTEDWSDDDDDDEETEEASEGEEEDDSREARRFRSALRRLQASVNRKAALIWSLRKKLGANFSSDFMPGQTLMVVGDIQPVEGPMLSDRDSFTVDGAQRTAPNSPDLLISGTNDAGERVVLSLDQFNSPSLEMAPERPGSPTNKRLPRNLKDNWDPEDKALMGPSLPGEQATPREEMPYDLDWYDEQVEKGKAPPFSELPMGEPVMDPEMTEFDIDPGLVETDIGYEPTYVPEPTHIPDPTVPEYTRPDPTQVDRPAGEATVPGRPASPRRRKDEAA